MNHVERLNADVAGEIDAALLLRHSRAFLGMVRSWLQYADDYPRNFNGDMLGKDRYAGPAWATIGASLLQLLSTDHGPYLRAGAVDAAIRGAMEAEGFNPDTEDWRG